MANAYPADDVSDAATSVTVANTARLPPKMTSESNNTSRDRMAVFMCLVSDPLPYEGTGLQASETVETLVSARFSIVSRPFPTGLYKLFLLTPECSDQRSAHCRRRPQ